MDISNNTANADNTAISARQAVRYLEDAGCPDEVIRHCLEVAKVAVKLAENMSIPVRRGLVEVGALLHDIGRCRSRGMNHVTEGVKIARELGLGRDLERIIERHVGAGLTAREAVELGLPARDYMPESPEEKIVAYADNLVVGDRAVSFEESSRIFSQRLGADHPAFRRMITLHNEIESWRKQVK